MKNYKKAPKFVVESNIGPIKLTDYMGKWLVLFFYDKDFTPVSTSEMISLGKNYNSFCELNTDIIAINHDSIPTHLAWINDISKNSGVNIPFCIACDEDYSISNYYDVEDKSCVYIISPDQCIVSVLTYPIDIGRNIAEILRIVSALQESQNDDCLMPANWIPGCDTFSRSSNSYIELMDKLRGSTNWYFDPKRLI